MSGMGEALEIDRADAASRFAPHEALAARLLTALAFEASDGSHDLAHILRVWANASRIAASEARCDGELLVAAVILHDCVAAEKNSPQRATVSRLAAARARQIAAELGWPSPRLEALAHAIEAHSFSAGIEPRSLEARILQDADRLDAIGAIGIARCFYVAGRLGLALYDEQDPSAKGRNLNDRRYALDHFAVKLLKIAPALRTEAGRAMGRERDTLLRRFLADLRGEVTG